MTWTFTDDPKEYASHAAALLERNPATNTLPLTVLDSVMAGNVFGEDGMLFGWYTEAGEVTGAVSMTPPYGILLAVMPDSSLDELVARLRADGVQVPDVGGLISDVERFSELWTADSGLRSEVLLQQRLYRLDSLQAPEPMAAGSARVATMDELELVMAWMGQFRDEVEPHSVAPPRAMYERRIGLGLLWLWLDEADEPVAMAGRNVTIAGMSRIGPVYTPPEHRQHGYGAAITHACTQDAIDRGATTLVLFTDLTNPTSNAIYQRLGYRPLDDRLILRFV